MKRNQVESPSTRMLRLNVSILGRAVVRTVRPFHSSSCLLLNNSYDNPLSGIFNRNPRLTIRIGRNQIHGLPHLAVACDNGDLSLGTEHFIVFWLNLNKGT
jgi:hypothetical protein